MCPLMESDMSVYRRSRTTGSIDLQEQPSPAITGSLSMVESGFEDTAMTVKRFQSQSRISTGFVYNAAVPRVSQSGVPLSHADDDEGGRQKSHHQSESSSVSVTLLRIIGCLGVIWGDLGTSPIYTYASIFGCDTECLDDITIHEIRGVFSCIFWFLLIIVTLKYIIIVMSCDFFGEGGIFALLQLIRSPSNLSERQVTFFTTVAVIGASAMIGDGLITPALSVLAAVEGLEIIWGKAASPWVVPVTVVILLLLYLFQFKGSTKVGRAFGPVVLLYFLAIAAVGVYNLVIFDTSVLLGLSPVYAVRFIFAGNLSLVRTIQAFGAIVLCVTGAEAVYADLGHFGKFPIYVSWATIVFPSLILSYAGQGAYLSSHPDQVGTIFYSSVPSAVFIPVWLLCTAATVVASQAMITGCYSLVSQGVTLGLFPRVRTVNTDATQKAQIVIPAVTGVLAVGTVALVVAFQKSSALAGAYGIAVIVTFLMTDILLVSALHRIKLKGTPLFLVIIALSPFFLLDVSLLCANVYDKIGHGGWFPVVVGSVLSLLMLAWRFGRKATAEAYKLKSGAGSGYPRCVDKLVDSVTSGRIGITPGTGVFLCPAWIEKIAGDSVPSTLALFLEVTGSIPNRTIFLHVEFQKDTPFVADVDRCHVVTILPGIHSVSLNFGFAEPLSEVSLLGALNLKLASLGSCLPGSTSDSLWFFVHSEDVRAVSSRGIVGKTLVKVYSALLAVAASPSKFFGIPAGQVVQLGDVLSI